MTAAHWVYLAGVASLIVVMVMRKNVIIPAIVATLLTTWVYTGDFLNALGSVFSASMVATTELLNIFLVLAVVFALLAAMRSIGADQRMIAPVAKLMKNGPVSFVVLFVGTYLLSLVFWPTPTLALMAAVVLPAAVRAGLSPLAAAMAIAIAGQGMALASDYVIGVAPSLSAAGAGVPADDIADRALVLSWIVGAVAIGMTYVLHVRRRTRAVARAGGGTGEEPTSAATLTVESVPAAVGEAMTTKHEPQATATRPRVSAPAGGGGTWDGAGNGHAGPGNGHAGNGNGNGSTSDRTSEGATTGGIAGFFSRGEATVPDGPRARLFAIAVPVAFAALVLYMLLGKVTDLVPEVEAGWGAALVGGLAVVLMLGVSLSSGGDGLERAGEHFVGGLVFAFKAMGVVIPVAGFVLVGISDFAGRIMLLPEDAEAPGFLFDAIASGERFIPDNGVVVMFAMLLAGMLIGLDGSGWAGLPFTGGLAEAFANSTGGDTATLAAIAQNGASWTGGGTLLIWSSLIAVAGLTGVPVSTLARKLFVPVVSGLLVSVVVAAVIW
ncbi:MULTISPECIES: hypothetical protein [unclassified Blastococcus]